MSGRRIGLLGILAAMVAVGSQARGARLTSVGPLGTVVLAADAAQAQKSASGSYTAPKTPWGHPDLQGVWNNSTNTPLERMTADEQERGRIAQRPVREATDGTGAAWPETGGRLERAFLIVDPPDGRIPMRVEAIKRLVDRENARESRGEADSWLDRNTWERCISRTL